MATTNGKRERAQNFTAKEVTGLIDIVSRYKHIVECKETDAVTWKEKDDAWNIITDNFNAVYSVTPRMKKSVKSKYEGLKKNVKVKVAHIRKEIITTGGGEGDAPELSTAETKLLAIMPKTIAGLASLNDDDGEDSFILREKEDTEGKAEVISEIDDSKFSYEYLQEYEDCMKSHAFENDSQETHSLQENESQNVKSCGKKEIFHVGGCEPSSSTNLESQITTFEPDCIEDENCIPGENTTWTKSHKAKNFKKPKHPLLRVSGSDKNIKSGTRKSLSESVGDMANQKLTLLEYQLLMIQTEMKSKEELNTIKKKILQVELEMKKIQLEAEKLKLKNLKVELGMEENENVEVM